MEYLLSLMQTRMFGNEVLYGEPRKVKLSEKKHIDYHHSFHLFHEVYPPHQGSYYVFDKLGLEIEHLSNFITIDHVI